MNDKQTKSPGKQQSELKKELGIIQVFSIASGAMISSGLFVLPAVVYGIAGPAIIVAYIFASVLIVPAMFSKTELATAMPKSGGTYFFVNRSLGPLFGTFAGLANWFSLALKSTFALLGMSVFLQPLIPGSGELTFKLIAIGLTLIFTVLNILSVKESGKIQSILVFSLLAILIVFIIWGSNFITIKNYDPFMPRGWLSVFTVTGMIFISYGGLTKIASIGNEIKNPGKTIPRAMFAAHIVIVIIYALTVFIAVGLLSDNALKNTLTPISDGGAVIAGNWGYIFLSVAAMLAFITTANAGIMAASRDPLAMAKDNLLPGLFSRVSIKFKTPVVSILFTAAFMITVIIFLDIEGLVKVASTMMLILFSFVNLSVILMRESKIVSYKPVFKAPFYPFLQIAGIIVYAAMIIEMGLSKDGTIILFITLGFFFLAILWYFLYSKSRTKRDSALIQIVERVSSKEIKTSTLSQELRDILIERDEIIEDRFDRIIKQAEIIDLDKAMDYKELFALIADIFAKKFKISKKLINDLLLKREADSTTSIHNGLAIPHIIIPGKKTFDILVFRSKDGINFAKDIPVVNIVFALAGSKDERNFHLQALMAIAQIIQNKDFCHHWMKTKNAEDLRSLILFTQRIRKGSI